MRHTNLRTHSCFLRICLSLCIACAAAVSIRAQTVDEVAIDKLITTGYTAYRDKDAATLLSLFSQQSPHLAEFKQFVQEEFAINEQVRIVSINITPARKLQIEGDKATARLRVWIHALTDTGQEAEGFGEMDHTLRLVKEDGVWRMWQVTTTAEDLIGDLLAAQTDDKRMAVLATKGAPVTDGLLKGLVDQAFILLEEKGNYEQATTLLNIMLKTSRQINSTFGVANALAGLGDVYATQGDYRHAANNYQQILKLAESLDSKPGIAAISVKIGNIHYYQGNYAQAMEYYQRSAKLYEELGSRQEIAYPLANIGNAYFSQGNYAQSLEYYQRSLKITEQFFGRVGTAYLLGKIGEVYAAQGDAAQALNYHRRSLKLYEEFGNRAMIANALDHIGKIIYQQGDYAEAAALSSRAAELSRESSNPEVLWRALASLGRARRALNQADKAREAYADAIRIIEKLREQVAGSEQDRQRFFEDKVAPYNALVDLLIAQNDLAGAFAYAERAKGRMLLDVLRHGRADMFKTMSAEEQAQERSLNAALVSLNSQLWTESQRPQPDKARLAQIETRLKKARLEFDAFETQIYVSHPQLKIQRGEAEPLSLNEAGALIPDAETALLEYVVTQEKTYLFVLTGKRETGRRDASGAAVQVYSIDIKAQELTRRVLNFRQKLADNSLDFRESAQQLYDLLIKPAHKELEGKTTVCIVPAGPLWELPFQALLTRANRYLLEDHALFYAPSLSILREMKRLEAASRDVNPNVRTGAHGASIIKTSASPAQSRVLLAFGNPVLSNGLIAQAKSLDNDLRLAPLPETEREVKSLGEIYGTERSKILTGAAAQEAIVKAEARNYKILHFATHGTLDNDNPLYSRLLLASSSDDEDGFLEAREIMKLNLHAEMAVLSACQTARGRVSAGEGLIGMSWALFVAGTPTTVASQWKVDANSTAHLMIDFHRFLAAQESPKGTKANKAQALRRAALKLASEPKYKHPFYWAGFVVVGNGM